ncbi:hypothetical protein ACVW0I_002031 [Bradyrhizobium sp. LM6.11]
MVIVLIVLSVWVLLNILFVLIVVPPRRPRRQPATTLAPAPLDPNRRELEQDEPFSLRHVVASVAMGAFFVLVPPAARVARCSRPPFQENARKRKLGAFCGPCALPLGV